MVSTYLTYRMYTTDYAKSVSRTLSDAQVSREQEYYRENIGNVKSVDDFLDDQRLYAYAMKAYGLEDMTYAKAFMRKVLESDISSTPGREASFVEKLVDKRYLEFARAFSFTPEGEVAPGVTVAQDRSDEADVVGLYTEQRTLKGAAVAAEVDYFKARMPTIPSADQLVSDPRLFAFALETFGLDSSLASESVIKSVLSGDLSRVAGATNIASYQALSDAFNFEADGSVSAGGAVTADQLDTLILAHYETTGNGSSAAAAAFKTDLFSRTMQTVTSLDDFVDNKFLRDYALTAIGLDPLYVADEAVRTALTADPNDSDGPLSTLDPAFRTLRAAFNFAADGGIDGDVVQTAEQLKTLTDSYFANYANKAVDDEDMQTTFYKTTMAVVTDVDQFLSNSNVYNYALKAFGLDPSEESKTKIKQVLLSDPNDPLSYVSRLRDSRYSDLAAAFNFGADGKAQGALRAQTSSATSETISLYTSKLGEYDIYKTIGAKESEYYNTTISTLENVDDLLADKRMVAYLAKAYGFEGEDIPNLTLKRALTSDLTDPKSFANLSANARFRDMAMAFNFNTDGTVKRIPAGQAQDPNTLLETQDLYIRQTIESTAGAENQGVRLALYFQRKSPALTSSYGILADKALLEVVTTALGLPDSVSQMDTDALARLLDKRLNVGDFKDPKKLDKFLGRFTSLYDLANQQTTATSPATILLSGQDTGGLMSVDLLSSIQSMNIRV